MKKGIKNILYFFLFSLFCLNGYAQQYGNEWINYSQKYFKVKVPPGKDGIYRIGYSALISSGIPVTLINPKNFQLFGRSNEQYMQEQYIYVSGETDNSFDNGDYIEFYAQHNDGRMDSSMYQGVTFHPNPYYSLVNDTAVYFLTWNSSLTNRRLSLSTDTSTSSATQAPYFICERVQYGTSYFVGATYSAGVGVTDPEYAEAEGYFGTAFYNGQSSSLTFNTANVYTSGPPAELVYTAVGASQSGMTNDHHLKVELRDKNAVYNALKDTFFTGYRSMRFDTVYDPSMLGSSTELKYSSISVSGVNQNRTAAGYGVLRYPHNFDMEGAQQFQMYVPDNGTKSFLKMTNFSSSASDSIILYDLTNHKRIKVVKSGSTLRAVLPNSGDLKWCYITSEGQVNTIASLSAAGTSGVFSDYKSLGLDSAYLIITHKSLMVGGVADYKTYRESSAGGSHNVLVADIDQLYDQYANGVSKHPLAIRNFCRMAIDSFPSVPAHLFLVGKSLHLNDTYTSYRNNSTYSSKCLVPSFGEPPSDILFTARIVNSKLAPAIPTGRLSARDANDVKIYLDKVIDHENNLPEEWMKNVLHFAGGGESSLNTLLRYYLDGYKSIVEDTLWGAHVTTFSKDDSNPISINTSDSLRELINNGVSMMTFFGHSSGQSWDVGIDEPQNYDNKGKYPFILSNGCYAGDIHSYDNQESNSESFVIIEDKGAIAFLAAVSLGIPTMLDRYSTYLEKNIAAWKYGKPIAESIKATINSYETAYSANDLLDKACMLEMTFHGDPAVAVNAPRLPDYTVAAAGISFDTEYATDSFKVYIVHKNIGMALDTTYNVFVERTFPGGQITKYSFDTIAPTYRETLVVTMPFDFLNGVGLNKFKVTVDYNGAVAENYETNNTTIPEAELIIKGNDIIPVYPYKYAIIPNNTVTLKASTVNPFAGTITYRFQIDTTDLFNSPQLLQTTITSKGGVITWTPPVSLADSTVYFWRVSADSTTSYPFPFNWRESSFQYITGKRGWGQAHFHQFKNDEYEFVTYNKPQRKFEFVNTNKSIHAQSGIYPYVQGAYQQWRIDFETIEAAACPGAQIVFGLIDPVSITPEYSSFVQLDGVTGYNVGQYNNIHCKTYRPYGTFDFNTSTYTWRERIKQFVDAIPDSTYVVAYTTAQNGIKKDSTLYNLYPSFEKLGCGQIRNLEDTVPYAMFGRKGAAIGTAIEDFGDSLDATVQANASLVTKWKQGYVLSEVLGPASSWDSLFWRKRSIEGVSTDNDTLIVIGVKEDGTKTILYQTSMANAVDMYINPYADATTYPYLQLMAKMQDTVSLTPAQLVRWQVIYAPLPEAAVNQLVGLGYSFYNDTLNEGEDVKFVFPIENISEYSFNDSLLITAWVQTKNGTIKTLPSRLKAPPFNPGEIIMDTLVLDTYTYQGANTIFAEVNPIGQANSQLEQYHFNNLASATFYVDADRINPLLDVTFDGIHILDGDIVSAKPNILVKLKDENRFLALNTQNDFNVFLKKPGDALAQPLSFGPEMTFTPANLPNNSCAINYTPTYTVDGIYELTVQAKDRSGNISGANDYVIRFEVVTRSTITNVMNYPNPFSTSTRFVFTLTGSEIPENFKVQILTITGKVIREITIDELGPIHIGRNITEYAWDGKDQFGDQLANGLYLYRVQTYLNGSSIEKRATDADKFFTKEFGKMYLMR